MHFYYDVFSTKKNIPNSIFPSCVSDRDNNTCTDIYQMIQVMSDDQAMFEWISELESKGICCLSDVTTKNNQIEALAEKVAFMRRTAIG